MTSTPNSRLDAVIRIAEDVVVVGATAITTWNTSHDVDGTIAAVAAAPLVRSAVASVLSQGRVSGLVMAIKLVWQALAALDPTPVALPAPAKTIVGDVVKFGEDESEDIQKDAPAQPSVAAVAAPESAPVAAAESAEIAQAPIAQPGPAV